MKQIWSWFIKLIELCGIKKLVFIVGTLIGSSTLIGGGACLLYFDSSTKKVSDITTRDGPPVEIRQ